MYGWQRYCHGRRKRGKTEVVTVAIIFVVLRHVFEGSAGFIWIKYLPSLRHGQRHQLVLVLVLFGDGLRWSTMLHRDN